MMIESTARRASRAWATRRRTVMKDLMVMRSVLVLVSTHNAHDEGERRGRPHRPQAVEANVGLRRQDKMSLTFCGARWAHSISRI